MHLRAPILAFLHNRELDELFACVTIRGFALSMIGIFVPIYLLTSGFTLTEVFIFYIIVNITYAISAIPAAHLDAKIGFKHVMMISMPLPIIFFGILNSIQTNGVPLWVLAIIFGVHSGFFWTSYHTDFATVSDGKHLDKEVGFVKFVIKIAGVFGPVIGGFIIVTMGFTALLIAVIVLLFVSVIPLFFSKDIHSKTKISLKKAFKSKTIKDWLALAASGFENNIAIVIWPVFIFFSIVNDFEIVGLVTTISLIFSLLFIVITSKLADKHRDRVMKFGSISNAIVWAMKVFATSVPIVFITDSLNGAANSLMTVPFEAKTYNKAERQGVLEYVLFRATAVGIGGALIFVIMLFVTELTSSFWMGAISSMLFLLF